jgi:hypothetical protein
MATTSGPEPQQPSSDTAAALAPVSSTRLRWRRTCGLPLAVCWMSFPAAQKICADGIRLSWVGCVALVVLTEENIEAEVDSYRSVQSGDS